MRNILITGSSSGLGQEFAKQFSTPQTRLFLSGRNEGRLEETAKMCLKQGGEVHTLCVDVTDREAMKLWISDISRKFDIDLVIANAGVSGGMSGNAIADFQKDYTIFETNLFGVMNTVLPAIPKMIANKSGHIVMISSMAGFFPMPSAPSYSASKAAVRFYGEALRPKLARHGIKVSVICPGFIRSRMTDTNDFKMPFFMETDKAVTYMISKINDEKKNIHFPWQMSIIIKLVAMIPSCILSALLKFLPDKKPLADTTNI